MPVDLHGNTYEFVAERMASLHKDHGDDYDLDTTIILDDPETGRIQTRTSITLYKTQVDGKWAPIPEGRTKTGHAEELRNSTKITTTSALETCETSSIGRALAACGYHPDGSYASADEVINALEQQGTPPVVSDDDRAPEPPAAPQAPAAIKKLQTPDRPFGMVNKFDKPCTKCGAQVAAQTGWTEKIVLSVDSAGKERVRWDTFCNEDKTCSGPSTVAADPIAEIEPSVVDEGSDDLPF
jgi:hypothetical protein